MRNLSSLINEKLNLNPTSKIKVKDDKSFYIDKVKSNDHLYMIFVTYNGCSNEIYECKVVGDVLNDIKSYEILISDVHTKKHWRKARYVIYFQKKLLDDEYYGVLGESYDSSSCIVLFDTKEKAQEYINNYTKHYKKEFKPMADYLYKYGIDGTVK